jgi:NAD(P)-dependent dehydrogenase (short-subunit alcohol dehydrogenase family)
MKLANEVSVITGAGRGIGRQIALEHAREGAKVALVARTASQVEDAVKAITAAGGTARGYALDVVDLDAVNNTFAAIEKDLGPVSVLVNNAAAFGAIGPIWDVDPATWWRDVETNVRGTFNCCRAAIASMQRRKRGRIINLTGGGTRRHPFHTAPVTRPARPAFCASPNASAIRLPAAASWLSRWILVSCVPA